MFENEHPKVSVIILNYNGYEDTLECLATLAQLDYPSFNIICIDNNSTDHSYERLAVSLPQFDMTTTGADTSNLILKRNFSSPVSTPVPLILVKNQDNRGFAAGCNQGIAIALATGAEFVWLLNNDTTVTTGALTPLVSFLIENPAYAAATSQIRYYDTPDLLWNCGGQLKWYGARKYYYAGAGVNELPDLESIDISFATGCSLLIHESILHQTSGFTEKFFFGEEDFDFAIRLKKAGGKMACCLKSILYHKVGSSITLDSEYRVLRKMYLHYLNRFINLRHHWSSIRWHLWRLIYICYIFVLVKKQTKAGFGLRCKFIKKLMRESVDLDGVDGTTFLAILNSDEKYFDTP